MNNIEVLFAAEFANCTSTQMFSFTVDAADRFFVLAASNYTESSLNFSYTPPGSLKPFWPNEKYKTLNFALWNVTLTDNNGGDYSGSITSSNNNCFIRILQETSAGDEILMFSLYDNIDYTSVLPTKGMAIL